MTKEQCEKMLEHLFRCATIIYKQFNPKSDYFTYAYCNGAIMFWNNEPAESETKIDVYINKEGAENR